MGDVGDGMQISAVYHEGNGSCFTPAVEGCPGTFVDVTPHFLDKCYLTHAASAVMYNALAFQIRVIAASVLYFDFLTHLTGACWTNVFAPRLCLSLPSDERNLLVEVFL